MMAAHALNSWGPCQVWQLRDLVAKSSDHLGVSTRSLFAGRGHSVCVLLNFRSNVVVTGCSFTWKLDNCQVSWNGHVIKTFKDIVETMGEDSWEHRLQQILSTQHLGFMWYVVVINWWRWRNHMYDKHCDGVGYPGVGTLRAHRQSGKGKGKSLGGRNGLFYSTMLSVAWFVIVIARIECQVASTNMGSPIKGRAPQLTKVFNHVSSERAFIEVITNPRRLVQKLGLECNSVCVEGWMLYMFFCIFDVLLSSMSFLCVSKDCV